MPRRRAAARLDDGALEVIAVDPAHGVALGSLDAAPLAADGACGLTVRRRDGRVQVTPSAADSFVLRSTGGSVAPGAIGGVAHRRAEVGSTVTFDGSASCDLDGSPLTPHWELVSAPRGSGWLLTGTDSWTPSLDVDADGVFRVELTVTDADGLASDPVELVVAGGDRCADEIDDDLDGLFDGADPDCDGPEPDAPRDATGFYVRQAGYLDAVFDDVDTARVRRDVTGRASRLRTLMSDGGRVHAVDVRRLGPTDTFIGVVTAIDPGVGLSESRLWIGVVTEPIPGSCSGSTTHSRRSGSSTIVR